jgi:glycosyltransferase involved in cell wall biosynthesis
MTSDPLQAIGYLISEYPAVSHTFIQREIEGLRAHGVAVVTYSIREPLAESLRGAVERCEHEGTFYIFPRLKSPLALLSSHARSFIQAPGRYLSALRLALRTRSAGFKALIYQLAYFAEAGILAAQVRKDDVTHLHVHFANAGCTVGMLAAEMCGRPFSFTMHGPTEFFDVYRLALPEKLERAAFVACISHFCRSQLMLFSDKSHWDKFHIIHCALDPDMYENEDPKDRHHVLFVGRMAGVKGVPLLLQSIADLRADLPALKAILVGDGPEQRELVVRAEGLGLQDVVRFTGYQTQQEVAEYMKAADVFVLASFAEGLPVVLMEALASATPVIATRIAGVGELVEDGVHGRLVAPGDQRGLTEALRELLEDDKARLAMGQAGPGKIRAEFDTKTEAGKLAALFSS